MPRITKKCHSSHHGLLGEGPNTIFLRMRVQSLALLSGLRVQHCHKMHCRLQMWLGSGIAVAMVLVSSCSSESNPSLGTFICHGYGHKKKCHSENNIIFSYHYL